MELPPSASSIDFQRRRPATHCTVSVIKVRGRRHPEHGGPTTISAAEIPGSQNAVVIYYEYPFCAGICSGSSAVVICYECPFCAGICPSGSAVVIHYKRRFRGGSGGLPVTKHPQPWVSPLRMMGPVDVPAERSPGTWIAQDDGLADPRPADPVDQPAACDFPLGISPQPAASTPGSSCDGSGAS